MDEKEIVNRPAAQPARRRRKKRYPKWAKQPWQKWLWRHWPPIRFGLICLAALLLLIWLGSMIVGAVSGLFTDKPDPSDPIAQTTIATEPTLSDTEKLEAADALLEEAEFIAAGYDYQGAIELLRSSEYFPDHPEWQTYIDKYTELDSQLVSYDKMNAITHVFFHSLIVDTDRAFDGDYSSGGYNQYMTTVDEFKAMLEIMYARGYVLVSPYDVAYETTAEDGTTKMVYGDIRLPEGKTPFLMSQDDVNYYGYMIGDADPTYATPAVANAGGDGFAHKLVIDENGDVKCEYIDADGNVLVGDYDLMPILETFIQEHPDFSYHGARAMLGVTGYEGVLGYRTKPAYEDVMGSEAYAAEVAAAKEVAQTLKDGGWLIVSHSYGHPAYGNVSAEKVDSDSQKWEDTCQPIVGETDIILYPHGSDIAGIGKYTSDNEKFVALYEDGYRYFFNVDSNISWQQLGEDYFRGGRRNLDGYRMYYNPNKLSDLFDVADVWDDARPTPVPPI